MYQCFLYMRDPMNPSNLDSNYYAFPLAISPVVDTVDSKVIRIEFLPTGEHLGTRTTQPFKPTPPNEYIPEAHHLRGDLKPLNVVQPEGASFTVTKSGETGRVIEWQKWSFRVGFNQREGMVVYNVGARSPSDRGQVLMVIDTI
jgi:primary-amine oxidase